MTSSESKEGNGWNSILTPEKEMSFHMPYLKPAPCPQRKSTVVEYLNGEDYMSIPWVVDVWVTQCIQGPSIPRKGSQILTVCQLQTEFQPRQFATGYIAWRLLEHYFPRDVNMLAYRKPHTQRDYGEIWSHVDLMLRKHNLPRIPLEVVNSVLRHQQVGQAILLLLMYETLTNLKLPYPIPRLHKKGVADGPSDDRWKLKDRYLTPTVTSLGHRSPTFGRILHEMYTKNQQLKFSQAKRRLKPPPPLRWEVQHIPEDEKTSERLNRLLEKRYGERCSVFHQSPSRPRRQLTKHGSLKKHKHEKGKSAGSENKRDRRHKPKSKRALVALLQKPFFTSEKPMKKQNRALVEVVTVAILKTS